MITVAVARVGNRVEQLVKHPLYLLIQSCVSQIFYNHFGWTV
jgi:hypothetical protein